MTEAEKSGGKSNEFLYNYDSNAHERKSSDKVPFFNGTETGLSLLENQDVQSHYNSLKSHEMELITDESTKKLKGIALSSKGSTKAMKAKVIESEDEASEEGHEVGSDDEEEMVLMAARVSQWAKRSKKYAGKFGGSSKRLENKSRSSKQGSSKERYKNKVKKSFLATWEDLDKDSDSDGDEEANLALMATTSDREDSEAGSDSEDEEEVIENFLEQN
ncbi:hypothetical protein QL285_021105 [Trifolium repens]|nr:hypothetical protein QL285_021105 [Trifolium repens]